MDLRVPARAQARAAACAVALAGSVLVTGAAAAPVTSVTDLRLSRAQAITGESVDLRVSVSPGVPRVVVLQRRAGGRWVEVARGVTDDTGVEIFDRATPRASTTYRVRAPRLVRGGTTYTADVSPARTLTVQQQKAFLRMPDTVAAGSETWAFVECFPHRPGRAVELRQRSEDGAWQTVAHGVQNERGMLTLDVTAPDQGVYEHRAVVQAAKGASAVRSTARTQTVTAAP